MNERFTKNIILVSNTSGGGGTPGPSYSYSVVNYSDLPLSPPDGIRIQVTGETVTNAVVYYDTGAGFWYLMYGIVSSVGDLPTIPVYSDVDRVVSIAGNAFIMNDGVTPYTIYRFDGIEWTQFRPENFVDQTIYADASALETAYPAASNTNLYGLAIESLVTKLYKSNGTLWLQIAPDIELNSIVGSYAGDAAANTAYTNGAWVRRSGDLYTDSSGAGTTVKRWSGAVWQIYRLDWDGTTAGQLVSNLPVVDIYTGAIAIIGSRAFEYSGAAWVEQYPNVSVTTFANLPVSAPTGYLALVTAETGLTSALVRKTSTSGEWAMERVTCTYATYSAIEWGTTPGEWYNTGGITVVTADGGQVNDTTDKRTFYWNETNTVFVPYDVYTGTLANVQKIKGDSTSPTGWVNGTAAGGGTATATTDGSKITLASSNPGSGGTSLAGYYYDDTSIVTGANVYIKGMFAISTPTGNQARAAIIVADGTDGFDFGSARGGGSTQAVGQWFNGSSGTYAAYTAVAAGTETVSSEVFIEFQKKSSYAQVRVNGGIWRAISGATARSSTATQVYILALSNVNGATSATMTLRHVASMRY